MGVFGYITGSIVSYYVRQDATDTARAELQRLRQEVAQLTAMLAKAPQGAKVRPSVARRGELP